MKKIKWNELCPKCRSEMLKWGEPSWSPIPDELTDIEEADDLDSISVEIGCESCKYKFEVRCSPKNWYLKN